MQDRLLVWSFLPTNHQNHRVELSLALPGMGLTWITYKLSNRPSLCTVHLPKASVGLRCSPEFRGCWVPLKVNGWQAWRINPGVAACVPTSQARDDTPYSVSLCSVWASLVKPDPPWFSSVGRSVLECSVSWVWDGQGWSVLSESQFDVTLKTLKFMQHFPWGFKTLF